jgi:hypothetical protein
MILQNLDESSVFVCHGFSLKSDFLEIALLFKNYNLHFPVTNPHIPACGIFRCPFCLTSAPEEKPFHMIKLTVSLYLVITTFPGKEG